MRPRDAPGFGSAPSLQAASREQAQSHPIEAIRLSIRRAQGRLALKGSSLMSNPSPSRRRPTVHITLQALRGCIAWFDIWPRARTRDAILSHLGLGLRTYYRELELLKRCGVKVRHREKRYTLMSTAEQAEGRLPFPDPQLSFAEMAELAKCPCEAGKRLAELLDSVINQPAPVKKRSGTRPESPRIRRRPQFP